MKKRRQKIIIDVPAGHIFISVSKAHRAAELLAAATPAHRRALTWLAEALLLLNDDPDLTDAEIAVRVKRNPGTLSRNETYQAGAAIARGQKSDRPKGHVEVDETGKRSGIEAQNDD